MNIRNIFYGELDIHPSSVLLSSNGGRSYDNITSFVLNSSKLSQLYLREDIGLMRDPNNSSHIVLVGYSFEGTTPSALDALFVPQSVVWVTTNGAVSWMHAQVPYVFESEEFIFHPTNPNYVLARANFDKLLLSTDGGLNWKLISENVDNVHWLSREGASETSFLYLHYPSREDKNNAISSGKGDCCHLYRTNDLGANRKLVLKRVYNFILQDKFTYSSVYYEESPNRRLVVSTDFGDKWRTVQLPDIHAGQFYSVVDVDQGMAFVHVDEEGDTGYGHLYASGSHGALFSLSLSRHFYPNYLGLHDLTRFKSIPGVLVATQMYDPRVYPQKNLSMRSVISYNQGATWQPLPAPTNEPTCNNADSHIPCALQIYGQYSQYRGIPGQLPLSTESAPGLIIVHGHVDDALQGDEPNVYVSRDGGYNWHKALDGPHRIEITNHGNVIAAVPLKSRTNTKTNTLKFSFDDGHCWHNYTFTNETDFNVTGLVTEPGNRGLTVAIWGFSTALKPKWASYVIDFQKLLGDRKCSESDLEKWEPHSLNNSGCILGVKHSLLRVKNDSMCYVDTEFDRHVNEINCSCTIFDYECEFGYYRPNMSSECVNNQEEARKLYFEMCSDSSLEIIIGSAYRRVPGDSCVGGFQPPSDESRKAKAAKLCADLSNKKFEWLIETTTTPSPADTSDLRRDFGMVLAIALTGLVLTLLTMVLFLYRSHLRRRAASFRRGFYRYSAVANDESDDAVERLLPSQRVEAAGGDEVALSAPGEGASDEAGGLDETATAVNIRASSSEARSGGAPRRSWFRGRRGNKNAVTAGKDNGVAAPGPSSDAAPTRTAAGGASRDGGRDRLLDSDDEMPLEMEPGAPAVLSSSDANSRQAFSLPPAPDVSASRANQADAQQATGMKVLRAGPAGATPSAAEDMLADGSDDEPLQIK